ncbi:HXXEE domain-containing protein [Clostridium sp. 19966]|uniref:HXXEE domain-containing protein n=1 Tax=Clostridium sp. 19966 TaxID=2768166 RepID=UPI0028DDF9A9|nr:HXXEE domain-containing protein [Clostridium sp. 19966]MDT8719218.1 HXXEE domain-containing protein [Clostridium sp. 19966]
MKPLFIFIFIWIFPVIFILHDFEEIIMITAWKQRNKKYIESLKIKHIPIDFIDSLVEIKREIAVQQKVIYR